MYKLVIEDDEGKKTVVPLIRDEITIGRREGNTIRLTERNVSRRHAKLVRSNGAVFIEDLESYNGIKVNGAKIDGRVAVAMGDRIQIGDYLLGLQSEGISERPAAPAPASDTAPADTEELPLISNASPSAAEPTAAEGPTAAPEAEAPADLSRLVCVSSNFAGLEAVLNKAVIVIGRTADNDIVINHRSISRHHAQIVEENGRYTIMDMQSVNGVRVNGEEYGKVELRRGDLIDLGHVRLRFVASGEKFNFATDATIFDMSQVESSRSGLWLALALVAVVIVGLVLWRVMFAPQMPPSAVEQAAADLAVPPSGDPGQGAAQADKARDQELIRQVLDANNAYEWKQALDLCARLSSDGSSESRKSAKSDCERAATELEFKSWFDKGVAAELRNEHKDAIIAFRKIEAGSVYHAQVQRSDVFRQAVDNYTAEITVRIDEALKQRECDSAERLADELANLVPEAESRADKVSACKKKLAALERASAKRAARTKRRQPRTPEATKTTSKKAGPSAVQIAEAKKTLDQAWKAYREGYYTLASSLARKVLKTMQNQQALSIVGASACYLKRPKQAQNAYNRLDNQRRQLLRRVCQRMGVPIN